MNEPIYIVDGVRTPFCKAGTDMASMSVPDIGKSVFTNLLSKTGINPEHIDGVIVGCVGQPADAANVARVIALRAGIPEHVPAITVHRNCASGFEAITEAAEKIGSGRGDLYLVAGCESMSSYPLLYSDSAKKKFEALMRSKTIFQRIKNLLRFRPSDFKPRIGLMLGLSDPVCGLNMGQTAEILARDFNITREEQDHFALISHQNVSGSTDILADEICAVYPKGKKTAVVSDNGVRKGQTIQALAKLKAIFQRDGTVTAGNASQITDGGVALLIASESACKEHNLKPIGLLSGYAYAGCEPERMGLGPVYAIDKAEKATGLKLEDADLIEINEAFAAQVIAVIRAASSERYCKSKLGRDEPLGDIEPEKLNVNGGGIALGHPVGATGARLVLTALKELHRRNKKRALVSLCVGGGQGGALWLEAINIK